MKILFCSPWPLIRTLGAAKAIIELADELQCLGWECTLVGPDKFSYSQNTWIEKEYINNLIKYLSQHAREYDVVEYNYCHLPADRKVFPKTTLMVARSQLLLHHLDYINIPESKLLKFKVKSMIRSFLKILIKYKYKDILSNRQQIENANVTMLSADLINVLNTADKMVLINNGIAENKIALIPLGLSNTQLSLLNSVSSELPVKPKVVFIGTFDYRKGAADFPSIINNIHKAIPKTKFCLLGTNGLIRSRHKVLGFFPLYLRKYINVVPQFQFEDLPKYLSSCSVGIFPSYLEGFPFGVLEMLASSVPVIAYNSPGPPMMLPSEYLVAPGDIKAMSSKVAELLNNRDKLYAARMWAKQRSQEYSWKNTAEKTSREYINRLNAIRDQSLS